MQIAEGPSAERKRGSEIESEAEQQRATTGEGGRATPSSTVYSARQSRLPVSSSTSGVSELTPILIATVEARSSHCPRVRLSLEGCTALEGIARRRMAGACAVSLFLCPERVKALRLGVERDRRKGLIRLDWAFLIKPPPVCAWCDAVFFTGSSWVTPCRCIVHCTTDLPPRGGTPPSGEWGRGSESKSRWSSRGRRLFLL